MIESYINNYSKQNLQFILVDVEGTILQFQQSFLPLKKGLKLTDYHLFFESVFPITFSIDEKIVFNCIHLEIRKKKYVVDLSIAPKKEGQFFVVIQDLTNHYRDYQSVAQSRNESIINSELVVLKNEELERQERFKNKFIQNFSYELRNPLTSIITLTNLLNKTSLNNEQQGIVQFIGQSGENLRQMLEDVLDISMVSSGKMIIQQKVFSLKKLVSFLEATYRPTASEKGVDLCVQLDEKLPEMVVGDRLRLIQVLSNLLDNAIKYTQKGAVQLNIEENQRRANKVSIRFSVTDTGIGLDLKDQERIFDSFSRLVGGSKQKGFGLGLSISKGILLLMGSDIKIESEKGEGSTFYFDLTMKFPVLKKKEETKLESLRQSPLKKDKKYKLLLAEDDEEVQMSLFKILADTGQFYIDLISDGALVVDEVAKNGYDLVLLNVNLPNFTGDQIVKIIREFPITDVKKMPIIGITANAYQEDVADYKSAGFSSVLVKPFSDEELLRVLHKFM